MMNRRFVAPHTAGWTVLCWAVLLWSVSTPVEASGFEGHVWGGAGAANVNHAAPTAAGWWGPMLRSGLVVDVGDFWRVTTDIGGSYHFERTVDGESAGPHAVGSATIGTRYVLDVFTYVPYLELAAAVHPLGAPSSGAPDGELLSLRAGIGLDYRMSRELSVGAAARLHAPVSQPSDFPHYSSVQLHVGYHFRWF